MKRALSPTLKARNPLEKLAGTISLEQLAVARGVALTKKGAMVVGTCPFHHGTKLKLMIDTAANTWTCSTCSSEPGSPLTWVMKAEGVSRRHAVELLRDGSLGRPKANKGKQKGAVPLVSTVRTMAAPFSVEDSDETILSKVAAYYHATLKENAEALAYLEARGLRHPRLVETFKLGFSDRSLGLRLPGRTRRAGADLRARLEKLGLIRDTGHEHLRGCLVVPLFDHEGRVAQLYGRMVGERLRPGTNPHVWLPGERRGLFNPSAFESAEIIVAGSIIDAMTLWCFGAQRVTAIPGLDGQTDDLLAAVRDHQVRRVILVFCRSKEGEAAAEALGAKLAELGVEVRRGLLPLGHDVNDVARSAPDPGDLLHQVARSAEWLAGKPSSLNLGSGSSATTAVITSDSGSTATAPSDDKEPEPTEPGDEAILLFEDRRWRIRGLADNTAPGTMKVNVFVSRPKVGFHVDTFDLYSARHRTAFVRQAGQEVGVEEEMIKRDLGRVLLALEQHQDELRRRLQAPGLKQPEMTEAEKREALDLLADPHLLDRVLADFENLGVVGEKDNLLLGFLAAVSRKLDRPLGVVIQSSSAAGKSSLMDAMLSLVPEEDRVSFSAMTSQSLYYMGTSALRHRVLSIAEEEGASKASYSLKLLQSEGVLTIASTGKDSTGRLVSEHYRVEGPVALMMTTTSIDVDEELLSRCIVLTVDESSEQTRRIHERQRQHHTLDGVLGRDRRQPIVRLHQNAQRLLRPVRVVVPFAAGITYADLRVRARRDHAKLLTLIEAAALVHQHQRPMKSIEHQGAVVSYIEANPMDVETATRLLRAVGAIEQDDLPPQTRRLLATLDQFAEAEVKRSGIKRAEVAFTRRQAREALGVGDTRLRVHLRRLVEQEFVVAVRRGAIVLYSLAVHGYDEGVSPPCRPDAAPMPQGCRPPVVPLVPGSSVGISPPSPTETSTSIEKPTPKGSNSASKRDVRADGAGS